MNQKNQMLNMKSRSEKMSKIELQKLDTISKLDWELSDADTRYGTHSFHPYSAKYIPQIPNYLISNFSQKNDLILDNFLGSGTTLVEAKLLGRNAIGVDINPLACLISKVKTTKISEEKIEHIKKLCNSIKTDILFSRGQTALFKFKKPNSKLSNQNFNELNKYVEKWFQKNVIIELSIIRNHIENISDADLSDFLLVAFSSILRSVSNTSSGFGNLMIDKNARPKTRIFEKFQHSLLRMLDDIQFFNKNATDSNLSIVNDDSRNLHFIKDESIDLICTHPPYMASVPYAEYQRLSLWWLGYSRKELEQKLIGGRRSSIDLADRFEKDMEKVFSEMYRVLKSRAFCCVVIGNPVYRGKIWKLNELLQHQGKECGFQFMKEITRGKYKQTMGKMKEEFVLIFKKD